MHLKKHEEQALIFYTILTASYDAPAAYDFIDLFYRGKFEYIETTDGHYNAQVLRNATTAEATLIVAVNRLLNRTYDDIEEFVAAMYGLSGLSFQLALASTV